MPFTYKGRKPLGSHLKAALLSSAYETSRRSGGPHAVYAPPHLRGAIPLSESRAIHHAMHAPESEGHAHVRDCIQKRWEARQSQRLVSVHATRQLFSQWADLHEPGARPTTRYQWLGVTNAHFNADTFISEVVASALFVDLTEDEVRDIRAAAQPPDWRDSAPDFYEESSPGVWDPDTAEFEVRPPAGPRYDFLEHVVWDWSPGVSGGIVNILDIDTSPAFDLDQLWGDMRERLMGPDTEGDRGALQPIVESATLPEDVQIFSYRLIRCIESKFMVTYEPGGLDVDDGSYLTAWQPADGENQSRFFLRASKRIRYSEQADLGIDLSSLLNLLAPAVNTMLMSWLTYQGIRKGLD